MSVTDDLSDDNYFHRNTNTSNSNKSKYVLFEKSTHYN